MKKYTVAKSSDLYYAWPSMVKLSDDSLFCVFTACMHHLNRDNSLLMYTVSRDRGRSWDAPKPFTDVTNKTAYYNNARVRRLGDEIVIVCDKIYKDENREKPADVFVWVSSDEAQSFSSQIKTSGCGIVPDIKELSNGNWLLTAHRKDNETEKLVQYAWLSSDRGKTWSNEITVGRDECFNLCEASVLECKDGTLVAFMRENSAKGYDCKKALSRDGGYTWGDVHNAAIPGCHRPTVGYLSDGRVMITYRFIQGCRKWSAENTFLALTDEESSKTSDRHKQLVRIMPLDYDRNKEQDCGYTDWVQFDDGEIYIVNYIKDDHIHGQIRGYSLYLNEVEL